MRVPPRFSGVSYFRFPQGETGARVLSARGCHGGGGFGQVRTITRPALIARIGPFGQSTETRLGAKGNPVDWATYHCLPGAGPLENAGVFNFRSKSDIRIQSWFHFSGKVDPDQIERQTPERRTRYPVAFFSGFQAEAVAGMLLNKASAKGLLKKASHFFGAASPLHARQGAASLEDC